MLEKDDDLLIEEYLDGDNQAFEVLFNRYKNQLFSYLIVLSHSQQEAEDLFQEIFLKVIDNLPYYRRENKFKQWLFTIARNMYLDRIKSKAYIDKTMEISIDIETQGEQPLIEKIAQNNNPDKIISDTEKLDTIKYALNKISPEQREVILLKIYAQLSFKEISAQLNIPIGTALARFSRGIAKMREILSEMQ